MEGVLREEAGSRARGALSPRELARRLLNERVVVGVPLEELTERVRSAVNIEVRSRGELSRFVWREGDVSLRACFTADEASEAIEKGTETHQEAHQEAHLKGEGARLTEGLKMKVRGYPLERDVVTLLKAVEGTQEGAVSSLRRALKNPLPPELSEGLSAEERAALLSHPERWRHARLSGAASTLAKSIWEESGQLLNPLHVEGGLTLISQAGWAEVSEEGRWRLSQEGSAWLAEVGASLSTTINPLPHTPLPDHMNLKSSKDASQGTVRSAERGTVRGARQRSDEREGLMLLLAVLIERGPAPLEELSEAWGVSARRSGVRRASEWLLEGARSRLLHLQERGCVERLGARWGITELGLSWLRRAGLEAPTRDEGDLQQLWALLHQQQQRTRESLKALLLQMDPLAFEGLICELLERLGYHDVQLTQHTHDMGVDIVAHIELGITSVREVVQVKRHQRSIHRPTLDALRGSLHRFEAVRGTLITTSDFSKGTREAAFERGAAPITLINGDKLIELLMQHELGVSKRSVNIWRVEPARFEARATLNDRWRSSLRSDDQEEGAP
jgi:restriction system protein